LVSPPPLRLTFHYGYTVARCVPPVCHFAAGYPFAFPFAGCRFVVVRFRYRVRQFTVVPHPTPPTWFGYVWLVCGSHAVCWFRARLVLPPVARYHRLVLPSPHTGWIGFTHTRSPVDAFCLHLIPVYALLRSLPLQFIYYIFDYGSAVHPHLPVYVPFLDSGLWLDTLIRFFFFFFFFLRCGFFSLVCVCSVDLVGLRGTLYI